MTHSISSAYAGNDTTAHFRDWGSKVSAALSAVGMVQTADTGQVNWSTVTVPTVANSESGYETWSFPSGANQTAFPIFLRLGYGAGSGGATYPSVNVQTGTGTDGAGNLTGRTNTTAQQTTNPYSGGQPALQIQPIYASLSNDQLFLFFQWSLGSIALCIAIGRTVDGSGAADARGLWSYCTASAGIAAGALQELLFPAAAYVGVGQVSPAWPATAQVLVASDGSMPVFPFAYISSDGSIHGPVEKTLAFLGLGKQSLPEQGVINVMRWDGVSHAYFFVPWAAVSSLNTSACGMAILWD